MTQVVEENHVLPIPLDKKRLGTAARRGPGLDERIEIVGCPAAQYNESQHASPGVPDRLNGVDVHVALGSAEKVGKHAAGVGAGGLDCPLSGRVYRDGAVTRAEEHLPGG